mmetsp:Transcript_28075/g.68244  ORF Transcript_28075/g.68244 Transcript_28075/m.68244 type:complete len:208 (-) Transcript_28075:415-1038(-)
MFPTDNPVKSLQQMDGMSNSDKAKTLLGMSNFGVAERGTIQQRLPRPRVVRDAIREGRRNPLDELMLPLIDESVRRQYKIRDAIRRGDLKEAERLQSTKSRRQIVMEELDLAKAEVVASSLAPDDGGSDDGGSDDTSSSNSVLLLLDEVERLSGELELLDSLKQDVTQDDGTYSRFLDRDAWYEQDRQRTAERVDKSKFGNLLDGIE